MTIDHLEVKRFLEAEDLPEILSTFSSLQTQLRPLMETRPFCFPYELIREKTGVQHDLWDTLDAKRRKEPPSDEQTAASLRKKVLISGGGIAGLRLAIELALETAGRVSVTLVEKRANLTRHNIMRLWPSIITDLKALGVKTIYRRFCAGGMDHISIKQLQTCLTKIALLLGLNYIPEAYILEVRPPPVTAEELRAAWAEEGADRDALLQEALWTARIKRKDQEEPLEVRMNSLIGAEGEKSFVCEQFGFPKKYSKAGEAIGITFNFVNHKTRQESMLREYGLAYFLNQQFFKELEELTGLKLENLVYYRGETHYFVMTAKRDTLLTAGILLENRKDVADLLKPDNIGTEKLEVVATKIALNSGLLIDTLTFALGNRGQPDIQVFDFTTKHQCIVPVKLVTRWPLAREGEPQEGNFPGLIVGLIGDALIAPFWPQGTGGNRAVLSAVDTAWLIHEIEADALALEPNTSQMVKDCLKYRDEDFEKMLAAGPDKILYNMMSGTTQNPKKREKRVSKGY